MRAKTLMILTVAVAVIAAAIAAIVVSNNRTDEARALAQKATAESEKAEAKAKQATKEADAERSRKGAAEENRKAKEADAEAAKADAEKAKADERAAIENRKAKEADAAKAEAEAETARANREAAALKAKAARDEAEKAAKLAEAEALKAQAEADKLAAEKAKGEKVIAEAKALELRQIDFQTLERDLAEWKRDLEEREAALRPEKTIADLSWVGGDDDMEVGSNGTVRVKAKVVHLAENDRTLPRETRRLAKTERLARESEAELASQTRDAVVSRLERLYVRALRENDVVHADYYKNNILILYPDWKFKGEAQGQTK